MNVTRICYHVEVVVVAAGVLSRPSHSPAEEVARAWIRLRSRDAPKELSFMGGRWRAGAQVKAYRKI